MMPLITGQLIASQIHPNVVDWYNRVILNGGAAPSPQTMAAVNTFYGDLITYQLDGLMHNVNCFVPDNLTAALTPLIKVAGSGSWMNANNQFSSSDLSINGLKGNGAQGIGGAEYYLVSSTKYLKTGYQPCSAGNGLLGLTVYTTTTSSLGKDNAFFACAPAGYTAGDDALFGTSTGHRYDNPSWLGRSYIDTGLKIGYLSGNRTSTTRNDIYYANSTTAHTAGTANTSTYNQFTHTLELWVFAMNYPNNASFPSDIRLSFCACHNALTTAKSVLFYTAIQRMRQNIGGGWV